MSLQEDALTEQIAPVAALYDSHAAGCATDPTEAQVKAGEMAMYWSRCKEARSLLKGQLTLVVFVKIAEIADDLDLIATWTTSRPLQVRIRRELEVCKAWRKDAAQQLTAMMRA